MLVEGESGRPSERGDVERILGAIDGEEAVAVSDSTCDVDIPHFCKITEEARIDYIAYEVNFIVQ